MQYQEEDEVISELPDFSDVDDFDDLDSLLKESVKLQSAKHAKSTGRKLTPEQEELLESVRLAREAQIWEVKAQYLVIRDIRCRICNTATYSVVGKYVYKVNRKGSRTIDKVKDFQPNVLKYMYYLPQVTENCPLCEISANELDNFDDASQALDLLLTL